MTEPELAEADVVALRFDDLSIAEDLATWCAGEVAHRADAEGPDEELTVILVPTAKGPLPARVGDWIVRRDEGDYYPCDPETFAARHVPVV